MRVAQAILNGLGYAGVHFHLLRAQAGDIAGLDADLQALARSRPAVPAAPRVLPSRRKSAARWTWRWTT